MILQKLATSRFAALITPLGVLLFVALVLGLTGCASTKPDAAPAAAAEPLGPHEATAARAMALQKIGESATDGETKRLAIMAVALMGQGGSAPAPVIQQAPLSAAGFLLGLADRLLQLTPSWFSYKSNERNNQTTETVAGINRDVSIAQSNNFTALGLGGVNGAASVGIAGMNSLATVASRPVTPGTNITGNTGPVLVGGGNLNSGSLNPTNPAPKVCAVGATGVLTCP